MKHLFFVIAASGILSSISIPVTAQKSVNSIRLTGEAGEKRPLHFIDGIELLPETVVSASSFISTRSNTTGSGKTITKDPSAGIESCTALQFKYALMMDVDVESLSNSPLYDCIDKWWATRYRYGGNTSKGIDCSSFAGIILNRVYGITTPRTAREQYEVAEKIGRDELKEGDLVFFNTRGGISHVGVYLGNGYFTHASIRNGVTISSLDENYYGKRYISGGRITPACIE